MLDFKNRTVQVAVFFVFWAVIILLRLSSLMLFGRAEVQAQMREQIVKTYTFPARRGRIILENQGQVAWSTRHVDLYLHRSFKTGQALAELQKIFPINTADIAQSLESDEKALIFKDMSSEQFDKVFPLISSLPLELESQFRRHHSRSYTRKLGDVKMMNGEERGIRGLERKYDRTLRGRSLIYQVLVDRHGNWVDGSYREVQSMEIGHDVFVKRSAL